MFALLSQGIEEFDFENIVATATKKQFVPKRTATKAINGRDVRVQGFVEDAGCRAD